MKHHVNRRKLRASIGLHTLLTVLSILWMLPVFWLLISSRSRLASSSPVTSLIMHTSILPSSAGTIVLSTNLPYSAR